MTMKGSLLVAAAFMSALSVGAAGYAAEPIKWSGLFPIVQDGKYGYIDRTGKAVIEPQFDRAEGFEDGMALIAMWK